MDYPSVARETEIVRSRVPGIDEALAAQITRFVAGLRALDLKKRPSVSETIDWARALVLLAADRLGAETVNQTLNLLLKYEGDIEAARGKVADLVARAQ
jgi:MoxR-like ATPase